MPYGTSEEEFKRLLRMWAAPHIFTDIYGNRRYGKRPITPDGTSTLYGRKVIHEVTPSDRKPMWSRDALIIGEPDAREYAEAVEEDIRAWDAGDEIGHAVVAKEAPYWGYDPLIAAGYTPLPNGAYHRPPSY